MAPLTPLFGTPVGNHCLRPLDQTSKKLSKINNLDILRLKVSKVSISIVNLAYGMKPQINARTPCKTLIDQTTVLVIVKNLSFKHLFVHLIIDDKIIRIFGQEVSELLDVLSGDMANFGWSLGSVAKQALDGDLGANAVLLQPLLEVFHSLSGVVSATVVAFVLEEKIIISKMSNFHELIVKVDSSWA